MTEQWPSGTPSQPEVVSYGSEHRRGRGFAIGAAALVGGVAFGVVGIAAASSTSAPRTQLLPAAAAQATSPAPSPSPSSSDTAKAPDRLPAPGKSGRGFGGPGFGGPDMRGHGPGGLRGIGGGVLHGEFVTPKTGGGYQTVQTQQGTATAVSATSITVKSADGFSRTYAVDKDTLVNASKDGITTIAVNDVVHVRALGAGDKATATDVVDVTKVMANRDKFAPQREKQTTDGTQSTT